MFYKQKIGKQDMTGKEIRNGDKIQYKFDFFGNGDFELKTAIVKFNKEKSGFEPFVNWKSKADGYDLIIIEK